MPDKYQIILGIDNSQADASARAATRLMKAYEQQCLAAAKAAQAALQGGSAGGGAGGARVNGASSGAATAQRARAVQDLAAKEAAAYDKIQERRQRAEDRAADRAKARQEREIARLAKAAEREAALYEKQQERKRVAEEKAAARSAARAARTNDHRVDVGLHKLQIDSIKATDARRAAAEKQAAAVSAIESKYLAKDYQDRVKAEKKKQAIDDMARSRTQKAIKDLETLEQSYRVRDYQARVAQEKRKEALEGGPAANAAKYRRKALTDEQAHAVAMNRITDVQNKRRIEGIAKVMGEERLSFAEAIHSALGLESAFGKVAIAGAAIGAVTVSVKAMAQAFAEAKKYSQDMAGGLLDTMKSLRQVAAVEGRAPDKAFTREVAAFGAATGLGVQGAAQFREAFGGRANIVKGVTIGDLAGPKGELSEFDKFRLAAGRIASIKGIPESQAGDLFGNILKGEDFTKKDIKTGRVKGAEAATNRAMTTLKILDAGAGLMNKLIPQFNELSAVLQSESELEGVIRGPGETAVVTSVLAEAGEGDVATMARNLSQGLRKFEDKDRAKFFKEARITDKDSLLQAIEKAMTYFEAEVGKGVPIDTAIVQAGFSDQREKRAMQTVFKAREKVLKPQMERLRAAEGPGGVEATRREIETLGLGEVQQRAEIAAQQERADLAQGEAGTPLDLAIARAKVRMTESGTYKKPLENVGRTVYSALTLGTRGGADVEAEYRAVREMEQRVLANPRTTDAQRAMIARHSPAEITPGNVVGNMMAGNPGPALASMFQSLLINNEKYVMYLEKIAKSNEDMAKADAARKAAQAPQAQPVAGPAALSDR